mmetsp:Transcript_10975/g.22160  ORF Transcript_10975/g.22160 Transcript_10975/m.22160 type:complete len:386 (+) Transcript_10975:214-1371(+)
MKERRDLYEQSKSKTVLFTSSTSPNLKYQQVDNDNSEEESHFTGLYRCTLGTLNDLQDDFTHYGEDEEICTEATIVGNGLNFHVGDRDVHAGLVLRNLQFDLSSLRIAEDADYDDYENDDEKEPNNRNNYLYANYRKEHYVNNERRNWEIVRARLPDAGDFNSNAVNTDGSLTFESVFQTWNAFDWNECDFCCCTKADYERKGYSDDAELFNTNYEYRHAYVRTMARSFVVDEHTGDIFVSWEGFYRDCDDDDDDKRGTSVRQNPSDVETGMPLLVECDRVINFCKRKKQQHDGWVYRVVSCRVVSRRVCSHHRESQRNAPRRRRWSERASTPGLATGRNSNGTITAHLARYRHTIEGAGTDTGTTHPPLRFSATVRSTTRVSYY